MFGHDDQQPTNNSTTVSPSPEPAADATLTNDNSASNVAAVSTPPSVPVIHRIDDSQQADPSPVSPPATPIAPTESSEPTPSPLGDSSDPLSNVDDSQPSAPDLPTDNDSSSSSDASGSDLLAIKQAALQQLSPLVSKLDQVPEEKFHTTMMMIQASDDQSLIQEAFDAAKQITDDKARAQALLDTINEINYFTQHKPAS